MAQIASKLPSEAEDGKLRFGAFFLYEQGSYTIFLRQWQKNYIILASTTLIINYEET